MRKGDWDRQRSEFNHGWLKNRFVTCVLRCKRVAEGVVEDDMACEDLYELVSGWDSLRRSATQILSEMESRIAAPVLPSSEDVLILGESTCRYLLEVERQRWLQLSNACSRVREAEESLKAFDDEVRRIRPHIDGSEAFPAAGTLSQLEERARRLGVEYSSLSLCEDTVLAADEYH